MANRIVRQLERAGEQIIIHKPSGRLEERHLVKLNKRVSVLEHLFGSLECLFHTETEASQGDLIELPTREYLNRFFFLESKNLLKNKGEDVLFQVTLRRMNCIVRRVIVEQAEDGFDAEVNQLAVPTKKYKQNLKYDDDNYYSYTKRVNQTIEDGFNMTVDSDWLYVLTSITYGLKIGDMIGIMPLSDYFGSFAGLGHFKILHQDVVDFPNMLQYKVRSISA